MYHNDRAFTQYQITVSYTTDGEAKVYIGWFAGRTAQAAVEEARRFVLKYLRPQFIDAANEVINNPT